MLCPCITTTTKYLNCLSVYNVSKSYILFELKTKRKEKENITIRDNEITREGCKREHARFPEQRGKEKKRKEKEKETRGEKKKERKMSRVKNKKKKTRESLSGRGGWA